MIVIVLYSTFVDVFMTPNEHEICKRYNRVCRNGGQGRAIQMYLPLTVPVVKII